MESNITERWLNDKTPRFHNHPTYNHERYIRECIDSVLSQTYPDWKQIIIDDGSTDKTPEIISEYRDRRIRYLRQKNVGIFNLSKTYNRALKIAKGELIMLKETIPCGKGLYSNYLFILLLIMRSLIYFF